MKCDLCGKEFVSGNNDAGLPNGISFVTSNGTITVCRECILANSFMDKISKIKKGELK